METVVVIVTGPPCSGKSTLAAVLAARLRLPLLEKDVIKEALIDALGSADRDRSRQLSDASFATMLRLASRLVAQGSSLILEGNFRAQHARELGMLVAAGATRLMQICCHGEGAALLERFEARARLGLRHPGHLDRETIGELRDSLLQGAAEPLAIPALRRDFDSTSTDAGQVDALLTEVSVFLAPGVARPGRAG